MATWSKWSLKKEDDWKVTYTPSPFFTANILIQFMAKYFKELIFGLIFLKSRKPHYCVTPHFKCLIWTKTYHS